MSTFTTFNGKNVATFICPKTTYHKIKFVEGGELPEVLTGLFTSEAIADRAIAEYIAKDKPKVKVKV